MKKYLITTHTLILVFILTIFLLPTRFTFLSWNIVLAVIPFDIALLIKYLAPKHRFLVIPLAFVWLIFYPNTVYMITDFAHLSSIGTDLVTSTQILNYGLLATGIFLGVSLGITSAHTVLRAMLPNRSGTFKLSMFVIISLLSSYAIYVGRFLRLNSWDIFVDLNSVLVQMHGALSEHALHFILVFTFVQVFLFLVYIVLSPQQNEHHLRISQ